MENIETKYEELVGKYIELKNQIKPLEIQVKEISDQIDQMLHLENINEKRVFIHALDVEYECKYVDRKTKSVDYVLLAEVLSDEMFNDVISEKTSTYLQIKPTPKPKSTTRSKPVEEKERKPSIPKARTK